MPYRLTITRRFNASHTLTLAGEAEPVHGHDWRVVVTVARPDGGLDAEGCVVDFHEVERRLEAVLAPMIHRLLNDLPPFAGINPSAEHLAGHIATALKLPGGARVVRVEVEESPGCLAVWEA